eukprot:COSAG01_NODE_12097_length_1801_cov_8.356639_1_plen_85_part_00
MHEARARMKPAHSGLRWLMPCRYMRGRVDRGNVGQTLGLSIVQQPTARPGAPRLEAAAAQQASAQLQLYDWLYSAQRPPRAAPS